MTSVVAVLALLVAAGLSVAVARLATSRRRLERDLVRARRDIDGLAQQVQALVRARRDGDTASDGVPHVITTLADPVGPAGDLGQRLSGREFASVALGESLLKAAALAHGVRRASSAANRNRIGFEMTREVKRQRRQRRLDLREARSRLREEQLRRNGAEEPLRQDAA